MFYAHQVRRTVWFLAAAALVSSFAVAPAGIASQAATASRSCAYSNAPASRATTAELRAAVVCLVNQQRRDWRLPSLDDSRELNRAAQGHTGEMVGHGSFAHVNSSSTPATRVGATGYRWSTVGENIAAGFPTAGSVVRAWMGSADHCRNILDPSYRNIGVGESPHAVRGAGGGPATWTIDLALQQDKAPPSGNTGPATGCPH